MSLDVLYVGTLPPHPGGSAISCAQLLAGLERGGHRVRAVAPITADTRAGAARFDQRHPGLAVTRFLLPAFEVAPDRPAPDEQRRLEAAAIQAIVPPLLAARRPDVVLVGRESSAWHVPDIAQRHGIPCVLRISGSAIHGILRGTIPPDMAAAWLAQCRKADLVVAQSGTMARALGGLGCEEVAIVANAIDASQFAPRDKDPGLLGDLALGPDQVVVAHVSNLKSLKRPGDVIASAVQCLRRSPALRYMVVGDGPCRPGLEAACRAAGIADRVRFVGWVDYDRVPDYVNLADLVVMTSEAEQQARVYLETQACGRVLVASDIPAARELIRDGETGLLFPLGDVDALAATTLRAAADPALRERIGRRARARAKAHAIEDAVAAWAALLGRVSRARDAARRPRRP